MVPENERIEIQGPAGVKMSFRGQQTLAVLLVILFASIMAFGLWLHDKRDEANNLAIIAALKAVAAVESKSDATQRAMIYVLSLPQAERDKLNLMKPKELLEMER